MKNFKETFIDESKLEQFHYQSNFLVKKADCFTTSSVYDNVITAGVNFMVCNDCQRIELNFFFVLFFIFVDRLYNLYRKF